MTESEPLLEKVRFQPCWARQTSLPEIVAPQQSWLDFLPGGTNIAPG